MHAAVIRVFFVVFFFFVVVMRYYSYVVEESRVAILFIICLVVVSPRRVGLLCFAILIAAGIHVSTETDSWKEPSTKLQRHDRRTT